MSENQPGRKHGDGVALIPPDPADGRFIESSYFVEEYIGVQNAARAMTFGGGPRPLIERAILTRALFDGLVRRLNAPTDGQTAIVFTPNGPVVVEAERDA